MLVQVASIFLTLEHFPKGTWIKRQSPAEARMPKGQNPVEMHWSSSVNSQQSLVREMAFRSCT